MPATYILLKMCVLVLCVIKRLRWRRDNSEKFQMKEGIKCVSNICFYHTCKILVIILIGYPVIIFTL